MYMQCTKFLQYRIVMQNLGRNFEGSISEAGQLVETKLHFLAFMAHSSRLACLDALFFDWDKNIWKFICICDQYVYITFLFVFTASLFIIIHKYRTSCHTSRLRYL